MPEEILNSPEWLQLGVGGVVAVFGLKMAVDLIKHILDFKDRLNGKSAKQLDCPIGLSKSDFNGVKDGLSNLRVAVEKLTDTINERVPPAWQRRGE